MLVFDGDGVVVTENNQPPFKMSVYAHFWWWWGSGVEKQPTTIENERISFLRVVGHPATTENIGGRGGDLVYGQWGMKLAYIY